MPAMFILAPAMGLVLAVLAVVVAGIRQEPSAQELTRQTPRLTARFAPRMAGLHVRRPDPPAVPGKQRGEPRRTAHGPAR